MQLRVGESPGIDGIPAEFYHQGEEAMFDKLQDLFTNCWGGEGGGTLSQDLRDAVIVYGKKKKRKKKKKENNQTVQLSRHLSAVH